MESLEEILLSTRKTSQGCPECGERNAAVVVVTLHRLDKNGQKERGHGSSASRSLSLCRVHAVSYFARLRDEMEQKRTEKP
jgi:hypothetical protein